MGPVSQCVRQSASNMNYLVLVAFTVCSWGGHGSYEGVDAYNNYYILEPLPVGHHDKVVVDFPVGYQSSVYSGPIATQVVLPTGHLADTPEVAAAKSHHLSAVAQTKAEKYYGGHAESNYGGAYGYSGSHQGYGIPVVLPSGHIADTHEVATAKSAHLLAVAETKANKYYSGHNDHNYGGAYGYSGSFYGYGVPVVLPNGHIAETHEVAAAKDAHMMAVAIAKAKEAHSNYIHQEPVEYYHEVSYEPQYLTHYDYYHEPGYY